eukprot:5824836-Alexandrium_andersonii.AAC.1
MARRSSSGGTSRAPFVRRYQSSTTSCTSCRWRKQEPAKGFWKRKGSSSLVASPPCAIFPRRLLRTPLGRM